MYREKKMIDQAAPILDFGIIQNELIKLWKILPDVVELKKEFATTDINACAQEILEHMIFDYWQEVNNMRSEKYPALNYKLAEA
tara:strand:+ start:67 stop:318 length:252 start_codon:yes stop_codon:yes gene_type:complete